MGMMRFFRRPLFQWELLPHFWPAPVKTLPPAVPLPWWHKSLQCLSGAIGCDCGTLNDILNMLKTCSPCGVVKIRTLSLYLKCWGSPCRWVRTCCYTYDLVMLRTYAASCFTGGLCIKRSVGTLCAWNAGKHFWMVIFIACSLKLCIKRSVGTLRTWNAGKHYWMMIFIACSLKHLGFFLGGGWGTGHRGRVRNFVGGEKGKGSFSHNKDNGFASLPYSAMLHVLMHLKSNFEAMFERDKWNLSNRSNQHWWRKTQKRLPLLQLQAVFQAPWS